MTFEIFVSSAVVSTIFGFVGNIIAAKIAQNTAVKAAQETATQEIKRMERTWEREDLVSSDEEFAAMTAAVARYVHRNTIEHGIDAAGKVAGVRSKEHGEMGRILDALHKSIDDRDQEKAALEMSKAIDEKRKIKGYSD